MHLQYVGKRERKKKHIKKLSKLQKHACMGTQTSVFAVGPAVTRPISMKLGTYITGSCGTKIRSLGPKL